MCVCVCVVPLQKIHDHKICPSVGTHTPSPTIEFWLDCVFCFHHDLLYLCSVFSLGTIAVGIPAAHHLNCFVSVFNYLKGSKREGKRGRRELTHHFTPHNTCNSPRPARMKLEVEVSTQLSQWAAGIQYYYYYLGCHLLPGREETETWSQGWELNPHTTI